MITRMLLKGLKRHLTAPEITVITGPRQAGKTTIMEELKRHSECRGGRTLFLSLDREEDVPLFSTQRTLTERLRREFGVAPGTVFIDEIQRKENAGLFLKGIHDRKLPYKMVVSGSGSLELKEHLAESLVGRKRLFHLSTLSFGEFAQFRTEERYGSRLAEWLDAVPVESAALLEEYLLFGGYPRVVLAEGEDTKREAMREIYQSYLLRDIGALLHVRRTGAFSVLVAMLAEQTGNIVNVAELSRMTGLHQATVREYLWYLEHTYILRLLPPYSPRMRSALTKARTVYFDDLGMCNFARRAFAAPLPSHVRGFLFQNLVGNMLRAAVELPEDLHYFRTRQGAEVDFIIARGAHPLPIEVKSAALKTARISRSLQSFIRFHSPPLAYVVNRTLTETIRAGKTEVRFVPFWKAGEIPS